MANRSSNLSFQFIENDGGDICNGDIRKICHVG